jgi:CBS domain-containing protein
MLVRDVMTVNPKTVTPETKLLEVASLMCMFRYSGFPVLETGGQLVGFIAEKDLLHRLFPTLEELMEGMASVDLDAMLGQYKDVLNLEVKDLMRRKVITIAPDMHVLRGAAIMVKHRFRRIPVAEGDRLVGMMSLGDVHKALFQANISEMMAGR